MATTPSAVISLSQQLIQRPSVTPDDEGCQALIGERLQAIGFTLEPMRFGDVDNLWARRGDTQPLFVFAGHTDVVPVGDANDWQHPPFSAVIDDGYLCGRGAADMKSSIAAMVTATEHFVAEHGNAQQGSIGFLLTSDEEGPAVDGTVKVIDALSARGEHIDWCIVGEPTSDTTTGDVIKNGRRGSLGAKLRLFGTAGHVAYPHLADNPIHAIARLVNALNEEHWDDGNEYFPPTTFQVSNISGGTGATNVIPATVDLTFNFRFSPESPAQSLQRRVEAICESLQLKTDIEWNVSGQPFQTNPGELINAVSEAINDAQSIQCALSTSGGTSDARFIAPAGAQVIELGPPNATIHKTDERIRTADVEQLEQIYIGVLKRLLLN